MPVGVLALLTRKAIHGGLRDKGQRAFLSGTSTCFLPSQSPSWEPIEKYINEQYEKFLKEEVNIARKKRIPDTRVHCCLYFISPTGHSYVPVPSPTAAPHSGSCQLCPFCLGEPVSPDGTQCRQGSVIAQTFSKRV